MFGKSNDNGNTKSQAPSGAMMLLRSIGFDPQEFMETIQSARAEYEAAKVASIETVKHFNARIDKLESLATTNVEMDIQSLLKNTGDSHYRMEKRINECYVLLDKIVSLLSTPTQHDTTKHEVKDEAAFQCRLCGVEFDQDDHLQEHYETLAHQHMLSRNRVAGGRIVEG